MKILFGLSLFISLSAFADFSEEHSKICSSADAKKLMGRTGSCRMVIAPTKTIEVNGRCQGKLADITCRVLVLKTSDSSTMNLICGEMASPILSQVLKAEVFSYNVSAIVTTATGNDVTLNDPNIYNLISNPALDVQISRGEATQGRMILNLQNKSYTLTNVVCE